MKTCIQGFCMMIITIITILFLSTIHIKSNHQNEVDLALTTAIQQTLKVLDDQRYPIESNEELISEFARNFFIQINSDSEVEFVIYGVDYEKGLLSIEVTMYFQYIDGKTGTVNSKQTMIIDDIKET
ncbi:hypothetical protein [Tannockella kyphosi]|uniref:hypothetical protein n=1 Tax=Tannockella kyphosi TaxID=2899121 RepID=UPI0020134780|nr:hypothetical protein [Tannockella kyphosi]